MTTKKGGQPGRNNALAVIALASLVALVALTRTTTPFSERVMFALLATLLGILLIGTGGPHAIKWIKDIWPR